MVAQTNQAINACMIRQHLDFRVTAAAGSSADGTCPRMRRGVLDLPIVLIKIPLPSPNAQRPLERRVAELDLLIEAAAGGPFDVASPKEVREVLFERLRLPVPACAMKPGRKHPSTDQEARPFPLLLFLLSFERCHCILCISDEVKHTFLSCEACLRVFRMILARLLAACALLSGLSVLHCPNRCMSPLCTVQQVLAVGVPYQQREGELGSFCKQAAVE